MNASIGILVDLVEADIVLAVAGVTELRHGERSSSDYNNILMYLR
jgi:hypothetical protein